MKQALEALYPRLATGNRKLRDWRRIGASFYLQAMQTEDIDAFVFFPPTSSGVLTLTPIYDALIGLGGKPEREHIRFGSWPLQVLPDATPLIAEAIRLALSVEYEGVQTRVFRPEHPCAVALRTGRSKDFARVRLFLEQQEVDLEALQDLAYRYGLEEGLTRARHDDTR